MLKLGIDIGSSHIGLGLYDTTKKKLTKKKYIPYKAPLKIFRSLVTKKYVSILIKKIDSFLGDTKVEYIGIACPGRVDTDNGIFYGAKELGVGKINFKKEFSKYNCDVYVDNGCNCAAVGEALNNNYDKFFMVTIGTGVGFSLIRKTRKKILLAKDETIYKIIDLNKKADTKVTYIKSFKKLSEIYNERQKKKLPREAIFEDARNNKDLIEKYITDFIDGINIISKEIKIKNICIGGGISLHKRYYLRAMQNRLPKHELFIAKNFNDAGLIGAVHLPIKRF